MSSEAIFTLPLIAARIQLSTIELPAKEKNRIKNIISSAEEAYFEDGNTSQINNVIKLLNNELRTE